VVTIPDITSPANDRIKGLVRLRNRRERDALGRFVVEGYRELTRALDGGVAIETLFTCPDLYLGTNDVALAERAAGGGAEIVTITEEAFRKASYRDRPEGLLAVAEQFDTGIQRIDLAHTPLVLVAEGIEKPGNLGTMLRTAEAAGCAGVLIADPTTDPFNPNVVRASLGTLFTVPISVTDTGGAIAALRSHGVSIVATTPAGDIPHFATDLTGPCAVVVGSEQYGLTGAWLEAADVRAVIPMPGSMDSLNAAMAAGIVLFEAVRQRAGTRHGAADPG
jgi:TrmH family RNA methyltransferase